MLRRQPALKRELIHVEGLTKRFPVRAGLLQRVVNYVRAVEEVNPKVLREQLGLAPAPRPARTRDAAARAGRDAAPDPDAA